MKKHLLIGLWLLLAAGCRQNEIEPYDQTPRVSFRNESSQGAQIERFDYFSDLDYLNGLTSKPDSVRIELMGNALTEPRTCCFRLNGEQASEIDMPEKILFEAGIYALYLKYRTARPEPEGNYSVLLEFDTDNPEHGFDLGKQEGQQVLIRVEFKLQPSGWNNYFGTYSNGKYLFMLDTFGGIYASIPQTTTNRQLVREAYRLYRQDNPPILDDDGNEIVFP